MRTKARLLLIEDDDISAGLIEQTLVAYDYHVTIAPDAELAWEILKNGAVFDTILLDRGLPGMDGMELLQRIKAEPGFCHVPVVMETGLDDMEGVREGLLAGAYYYLTKPLQAQLMVAVIQAAVDQYREFTAMQAIARDIEHSLIFLKTGTFNCRTLVEARALARGLARACPNPGQAIFGLQELLVNAVEHGNLGISYTEKTQLMLEGRWLDEIERREADSVYQSRMVTVHLARKCDDMLSLTIEDEGEGFSWENYLELSPERAFHPHGRGIAMARMTSFDAIEYKGKGNTVTVTIMTPGFMGKI